MPFEKSRYSIGNKLGRDIVAYDGTFLVDPSTVDLVRLSVRADGLPAELKACEAITTLDYGRVRLNNTEFLLPSDVSLQIVYADGGESENRTVFSGCHEFLGESSLNFDTPRRPGWHLLRKPSLKACMCLEGCRLGSPLRTRSIRQPRLLAIL